MPEALKIVIDRRGVMYDPIVVDQFLRMEHKAIDALPLSNLSNRTLSEIAASRPNSLNSDMGTPLGVATVAGSTIP
jgi:hypothetical protein